ncbi:hypothetical protein KPSA1_05592 [Pseudomonas syringae pv. actinidiae]|uniref:Uncharacterized protein n=1 Tax=Pseudomonas syringae pv. actinidiae TaxID=103796 RepID=A0A2V0QNE5_PSESF|nr:hypothetical protein KPSA1_05592 [Pseudomonas syringae pv. actinidiae]
MQTTKSQGVVSSCILVLILLIQVEFSKNRVTEDFKILYCSSFTGIK